MYAECRLEELAYIDTPHNRPCTLHTPMVLRLSFGRAEPNACVAHTPSRAMCSPSCNTPRPPLVTAHRVA